jgi:pyridoxine 4-dehydrogenase
MERIARLHHAQPAEVALNWCRAHGAMPIPGLRRPDQAEAVAAALAWEMTFDERQDLDLLARELEAPMPANPFQSD